MLASLGLVLFALALWLPLPERLTVANSRVIEYRDGTTAHVFLAPDETWRVRVRLDEVDPAYVKALLALEDRRFWSHPGVDALAVGRAALTNLARGRRVSGASTLTMQLVRVLEPRPRTLRSKAIEAFRALQLELHLSKAELLAAYLQFTPYGRNLEGVEAASLAYFGHRATALSPAEICTLLAVPQNPNARYPSARNQVRLTRARDAIAERLLERDALPRGRDRDRVRGRGALGDRGDPRCRPRSGRFRARLPTRRSGSPRSDRVRSGSARPSTRGCSGSRRGRCSARARSSRRRGSTTAPR